MGLWTVIHVYALPLRNLSYRHDDGRKILLSEQECQPPGSGHDIGEMSWYMSGKWLAKFRSWFLLQQNAPKCTLAISQHLPDEFPGSNFSFWGCAFLCYTGIGVHVGNINLISSWGQPIQVVFATVHEKSKKIFVATPLSLNGQCLKQIPGKFKNSCGTTRCCSVWW